MRWRWFDLLHWGPRKFRQRWEGRKNRGRKLDVRRSVVGKTEYEGEEMGVKDRQNPEGGSSWRMRRKNS